MRSLPFAGPVKKVRACSLTARYFTHYTDPIHRAFTNTERGADGVKGFTLDTVNSLLLSRLLSSWLLSTKGTAKNLLY